MRVLSDDDYGLFEYLVSLDQNLLQKILIKFLRSKYSNVIVKNEYVIAIGDIPIALVAHMDTVFKRPVENLYYDREKGILWSPEGLGADDRAGIFAIIKIIQRGFRPSIIFTTDEEKGGLGALALAMEKCPISDLKYMIELDRRGENDCVFYNCYCPEFVTYVENFGFKERWGSFSDISFLMPEWKICGVNLSIGYENEHSYVETLNVDFLFKTIYKVQKMLKSENIPFFIYKERSFKQDNIIFGQHCSKCKKLFSEYELIPVKNKDDKIKYYCAECIANGVRWCDICGEAFEVEEASQENICKGCAEKNV